MSTHVSYAQLLIWMPGNFDSDMLEVGLENNLKANQICG